MNSTNHEGMRVNPQMTNDSIPAGTRLGHILLNVADLDRAVSFYRDVLGFDVVAQLKSSAFVAAGPYYHHIGLATWESQGGSPPPPGSTGLNHFALNYPERRDLAVALKRVLDHDWNIVDAADYGTHESIYLHDPDSNKIELAWDREPSFWPQGEAMVTTRISLDFASLLTELGDDDMGSYLPKLAVYT
jgi:catechol 2,3-dioxygenase